MAIINRDAEPFYFEGNQTGCLVVHGFTGSPGEVRPLGEKLGRAGYTVSGIRLAGHGTSPEDMLGTTWQDWYKSVQEGILKLQENCNEIFLIGLSMGGLLSLHASLEYRVRGIITLNSPIYLFNKKVFLAPLIKLWKNFEPKPAPLGQYLEEGLPRFSYNAIPIPCVASFLQLIKIIKKELPKITASTLIIQSELDELVNPKSALYIYDKIGSKDKKILFFQKSDHIITLGKERETVFEEIIIFLSKHKYS